MRFLFTLALLAAASCTSNETYFMHISKALPVKIWLNGELSYNGKQSCNRKPCWQQPWHCSSDIRTQLTEDILLDKDYVLKIIGKEGLIEELPYTRRLGVMQTIDPELALGNPSFVGGIGPWEQYGVSVAPFTWVVSERAHADGTVGSYSDSRILHQARQDGSPRGWPIGHYRFRLRIENNSTGGADPEYEILIALAGQTNATMATVSDAGVNLPRNNEPTDYFIEFDLEEAQQEIGFSFYKAGPSSGSVINLYIAEIEMVEHPTEEYTDYIYDLVFKPEDLSPGLCDQDVYFELWEVGGDQIGFTDSMEISSNFFNCMTTIKFWNDSPFEGIMYDETSPQTMFEIVVPAEFEVEDQTVVTEDASLSDGEIVRLATTIGTRKLIKTGHIPDFFNGLIVYALSHDNVLIDNRYWVRPELSRDRTAGDRLAIRKSEIWLTEKEVDRNIF